VLKALVDHQLIDVTGQRCGNVDDVELEWSIDKGLRIVALLCGPGILEDRMTSRTWKWIVSLGGVDRARVYWSHVDQLNSGVELRYPASDYALDRRERRAEAFLERVFLFGSADRPKRQFDEPAAQLADIVPRAGVVRTRASALIGSDVVTTRGESLGRLADVMGPIAQTVGEADCQITDLVLGWAGRLERYGFPCRPSSRRPASSIVAIDPGVIRLDLQAQRPQSPD
jgi:sporulation protein YlmC with PRC-barrel domain